MMAFRFVRRSKLRAAAGQQYAIIVGLIAVIAILAITQLGGGVNLLLQKTGNTLGAAVNASAVSSTPSGPTGPVDPNFNTVTLLMHMDGANGSTNFVDVKGRSFTRSGVAQISTTQSKFGGASLALLNSGDYLTGGSSCLTPGTGDYTVEMWVYRVTDGGNDPIFDTRNVGSQYTNALVIREGGGQIFVYTNQTLAIQAGSLSLNAWHHIALVRASGTLKLYVNGVSVANVAMANALTDTQCLIGRFADTTVNQWNGYVDDLRVSTMARYTTNFTPPTSAFPDQ